MHAYLTGRTDTVDVGYLDSLGDGVVPHLVRLTQEAEDAFVRQQAKTALDNRWVYRAEDFRGLNYVSHTAAKLLPEQE